MGSDERRLVAIFAADVAGYSRLMRADEQGTLRALQTHRRIIDSGIADHRGRIANTAGDSILAEFSSVVDAVRCALTVQRAVADTNAATRPGEQRLQFRIGVHVGDVVVKGGDLFGDGVNVAARLQALAEPGGLCLSEEAHRYAARPLALTCTDLGQQDIKNIDGGIRVFSVRLTGQATPDEQRTPPTRALERPSVAVLPFENLSGNGAESHFSDGITDEIITGLARFRSLFVIARNSSFAIRDHSLDLAEVGRRLGVSFLVQGNVRRTGDRLRVTAQLVEAGTGVQLWAERYDRHVDDVFAVQDEVAQTIASTLFGRIEDARLQLALRKPTESMAAYDFFLRGLAYFRGYEDDSNQQAAAMLERAVSLDPQFALAQSYLAFVRCAVDGYAAASRATLDAAFAMAAQAVDRDPQESRCHRLLGLVCVYRRELATAQRHLDRALQLNPNDADAMQQMGYVLTLRGKPEDALAWMERSRHLNPFHPTWYNSGLGTTLYSLRRYADAAETFRRLPNPGPWSHARLAACYSQLGEEAKAKVLVDAVLQVRPDFSIPTFLMRDVLLERAEDREHLREGLIKAGFPS
ncbi:adenylate/guanylate cyclase domain-containing protein [Microvirga sp. HBU67558]|nr:adenylate/guanylate cyclase domain-containing protein [Microvirga sp. HBU67558]